VPNATGVADERAAAPPDGRAIERAGAVPDATIRTAPAVAERAETTGSPFWRPWVDSGGDTVSRVYGVRLPGLTLLLAGEPAPHDLPEIAAAARPLLDLLASRGLLREQPENSGLLDPTEGAQR
jgi:hypothetical protein